MTKKNLLSISKNFAALVLGTLLAIAILEVGLRAFSPFETRLRGDEIVLPANRQYIYDGSRSGVRGVDATITHTKNSLGLRGPELREDVEYQLKIIAVGGSTTECQYLSDGKDWPSQLHRKMENDFSSVWMNNAGLDGHSTFGHYVLLRDHIVELQPDVVIFMVGLNDQAIEKSSDHVASHIRGTIRFSSLEGFVKSLSAYSEVASLSLNIFRYSRAKRSGLEHGGRNSLFKADAESADLSAIHRPHIESYVPAYEQRLRRLVALSKENEIDPILVTQSALYGEGTVRWSVLELYNEATRRVGDEDGVMVVDLARKLPHALEYFYDAHHFTNAGSAEVARILYDELKEYFKEKVGGHSAETETLQTKSKLSTGSQ